MRNYKKYENMLEGGIKLNEYNDKGDNNLKIDACRLLLEARSLKNKRLCEALLKYCDYTCPRNDSIMK